MHKLAKHKIMGLLFLIWAVGSFGQTTRGSGEALVKVNFDTTQVYVSIGDIIELSAKGTTDTLLSLKQLSESDTILYSGYGTLKYKTKTYQFNILPALQKAIAVRRCTIYFKGELVPARNFYTTKKKNTYYYNFAYTNKTFLKLNIKPFVLINESW